MGYIYSITNQLNGKQYIGQRSKSLPDNSYFGSGHGLKLAIKKYGKTNFVKQILFVCENTALDSYETLVVTKYNTKSPNGYNLTDGGNSPIGYKLSLENRKRISEAGKVRWKNPEYRKKMMEAQSAGWKNPASIKRASRAAKLRLQNPETRKKIGDVQRGRKASAETRKKMSDSHKLRWSKPGHRKKMVASMVGAKARKRSKT